MTCVNFLKNLMSYNAGNQGEATMKLTAETTVRDVLTTYPKTLDVFLSHGMCEDCRTSPPPVPLAVFAIKHCGGDLERLVSELNGIIEPPRR